METSAFCKIVGEATAMSNVGKKESHSFNSRYTTTYANPRANQYRSKAGSNDGRQLKENINPQKSNLRPR